MKKRGKFMACKFQTICLSVFCHCASLEIVHSPTKPERTYLNRAEFQVVTLNRAHPFSYTFMTLTRNVLSFVCYQEVHFRWSSNYFKGMECCNTTIRKMYLESAIIDWHSKRCSAHWTDRGWMGLRLPLHKSEIVW